MSRGIKAGKNQLGPGAHGHGDVGVVFLTSLASATPGMALLASVTWAW